MMKTEYCVVEEKYMVREKEHLAYGIAEIEVYEDSYNVVSSIHNICLDFEMAEKIAQKCNRFNLSSIHFEDVIQDLLNDV